MTTHSTHRPSSVALALLAWLPFLLAACGGGGGDAPATVADEALRITSPTSSETYSTDRDTVSLSGSAFVPAGAECTGITGTMPAGYGVSWTNSATGATGNATSTLGCLLQVNVIWQTADPARHRRQHDHRNRARRVGQHGDRQPRRHARSRRDTP